MGILNHRLGILLGISTSRPNPWLVVYFIQGLSKERNKTESNKLFFIYVYSQLPQARVVNSNYLYLLEGSKH